MTKRIIATIAAILLVVAIVVLVVPTFRNTVTGWFTSNTQVDDSNGTTESTEGTQGTEPTEPTEGEEVTDPTEPKDEEVKAPFTFGEFFALATTDGAWNVAPEKAIIYDLTDDEFVVESEEERNEFFAALLRVNPYGAMSIVQEGFEAKENHAGEAVAPIFELCDCKENHKESFDSDMGQFHWHVAEGNLALGAKSWTRMNGDVQEYLMSYENREMIRNVACYWFVENENGEMEVVYGVRVCGDQKDPEPPVVEPEEETATVTYKFRGENLPKEVTSLEPAPKTAKIGETVYSPNVPASVTVGDRVYSNSGWTKEQVTVNGDITIYMDWVSAEKENPGEGDEEETATITYKFRGENLPKEVTSLEPAPKTVKIGETVYSPNVPATVTVANGVYSNSGWSKDKVIVNGDITIYMDWKYTENEKPPVEDVLVSYVFVDNKGNVAPAEVQQYLHASYNVVKGTIVTPKAPAVQVVETENGTYTWVGYDQSSVVANAPVVFKGVWKFKEKLTLAPVVEDYLVTFRVTCTNGNYSNVINTPAAVTAHKGDTVKAPAMQEIIVVDGGKLVWNGWSANSITVVGDAVIDGTYTYHADPKPEHTPTEPADEDPNPVADNQHELDGLGERTDEVPQNTPEHSAQEELSLMPVVEEEEDDDQPVDKGINNQHSNQIDDGARTDVDADEENEEEAANNGLSLMPVEGEADSAEDGESDDLTLSLDLPVDDSEVADQETQDELNAMFGNRE